MQVKITRISKRDTDKAGAKLISKAYGTPYFNIGIQTDKTGDEWLSAFANKTSDPVYQMEEGGTYSITIIEKAVGDRTFKNFKLLTPEEKELEELRAFKSAQIASAEAVKDIPENDVDLDKF